MHLDYLVNLPAEVVDYEEQTALRCHECTGGLLGAFLAVERIADTRVIEGLPSCGVVQGHELARHEVVLDFEKSYVLFAAAD
jgi:hypothetical protein